MTQAICADERLRATCSYAARRVARSPAGPGWCSREAVTLTDGRSAYLSDHYGIEADLAGREIGTGPDGVLRFRVAGTLKVPPVLRGSGVGPRSGQIPLRRRPPGNPFHPPTHAGRWTPFIA